MRGLPWPALAGEGRVYAADGNAYFNRPGPRIVDSLEILAACVHPARFADLRFRHAEAVVRVGHDGSVVPWARPRAERDE